MDPQVFDALTTRLANARSRRGVLRRFVAVIAGGAATSVAVTGADAAPGSRRTCRAYGASCLRDSQCCTGACLTSRSAPRNRRNRCVCPTGMTRCGGTCVDLMVEFAQCGACDTACDPERADSCAGGECMCGETPACADGFTCSEGTCLRTVCMDYKHDCTIGVDGTVLSYADENWTYYGLTTQVNTVNTCATDSECQATVWCFLPVCRCAVEEWGNYGGFLKTDYSGGPGNCIQGNSLLTT